MPVFENTIPEELYSITNNTIINDLYHYVNDIDLSAHDLSELAKKIISEYPKFVKDIRNIAIKDTKIKKAITSYKDQDIVYSLLCEITEKNINDYYRNAMIAILKVLETVQKKDINRFVDDDYIERELFVGIASFLHQLLFQIKEFTEHVATYIEKKKYIQSHSRKKMHSIEIMAMARNLPRHQICYNDIIQNTESIFLIRQAIEVRTQELLEIKCVWDEQNKKEIKISPDAFIRLLNDDGVVLPDGLSVKMIEKIHAWTNLFVHTGFSYFQWETEFFWEVISKYIFYQVDISKDYMLKIPEVAKNIVDEDKRDNCKIIMTNHYHEKYSDVMNKNQ